MAVYHQRYWLFGFLLCIVFIISFSVVIRKEDSKHPSSVIRLGQAFVEGPPPDECTAGVADGDVTIDGRPLLWKLRNEIDVTNDLHYFISGVEHYPGLGPAAYSFLGIGPADDYPEGPVRQGLNSQGLAVGWNVLDNSGWQLLHHQALGYYNTVSQARSYLNQLQNLSTYNYFIDQSGEAALWESQPGLDQHWEYNTRASARDSQWIDVDNADGDNNYATGTDVSLSGWVVRANDPGHFNSDGSDDLSNTGRYQVGRDIVGSLIYNHGYGTALSAKNLAKNFFRNNTLARPDTVSNMIVQGVLPTEDPRLSTAWVLLGHSETGIFVPVWLHGIEFEGTNHVPQYLDHGDDGISVYNPVMDMYNTGYNQTNLQARTLPFEGHLFDVVNNTLLPDWRSRDWTNITVVTTIAEEMKRIQEQMDADAYEHLKYLDDQGPTSNYAPTISIDSVSYNGLEATFSVTTSDTDNDTLTSRFNYGDDQNGQYETHTYAHDGHYLVSCTVTDKHGISQTDWLFVTVTAASGAFNKYAPVNGAMGVAINPLLDWQNSTGATEYQYCYDSSINGKCDESWHSTGTTSQAQPSWLNNSTHYEWQVRATNVSGTTYANGNASAFWDFTTVVASPGAFNKSTPTDGAIGVVTAPTLKWESSSGTTNYDYCINTNNDNACSNWTNAGTNTSALLEGLSNNTLYYWQVKATNKGGTTYANISETAYWSFTTIVSPPGTFNNATPTNGATGVATNPILDWQDSLGATSYEYCYDTTNDSSCSNWISSGSTSQVPLSGLNNSTTYYWKVRAVNAGGTSYANDSPTAFWKFTTVKADPMNIYLPITIR